jgi:hypothetical protein
MTAPRRQRKLSPPDPSFLGRGLLAAAVATGGPLVSAATTLVAVIARGVAVPGDPGLWLIEDRDTFTGDVERRVAAADRRWPAVQLTLSP